MPVTAGGPSTHRTGPMSSPRAHGAVVAPRQGLSVLVTGGGSGFGRAFAEALANQGGAVMITGRHRKTLLSAAGELRGRGCQVRWTVADTTSAAQSAIAVQRTVDAFGRIDVLVNNAAIAGPHGPTWEVGASDWWRTIQVNLRGCEISARAALPAMIRRRSGRLINIVSHAGVACWPYASAYSVSKAAVIKLTENLAGELRAVGVSVFAFDPGLLDIGMTRTHIRGGHTGNRWSDDILDWVLRQQRAGRFTPVEQATAQLLRIVYGAADGLSGRCISSQDDLLELQGEVPRSEEVTRYDDPGHRCHRSGR